MRTSTIYCAIGDIHGELERLQSLHRQVRAYAAEMLPDSALQFIHLGDLIDRGPNSCGVLDYLMEFEATTSPRPITLRGNHEQMMIEAHDGLDPQSAAWRVWTMNGGAETMGSYAGVTPLAVARHLAWLESLPTIHEAPEAGLVFVHAGIDPDLFPDCGDRIRIGRGAGSSWIRVAGPRRACGDSAWCMGIRRPRIPGPNWPKVAGA
jgi:serine/threonine protein phosphatase 1